MTKPADIYIVQDAFNDVIAAYTAKDDMVSWLKNTQIEHEFNLTDWSVICYRNGKPGARRRLFMEDLLA
jgi:hypothetical protein